MGGALGAGCGDFFKDQFSDLSFSDISFEIRPDTFFDPTMGKGVGEACTDGALLPECRYGLRCVDSACKAVGDTQVNRPCILTEECADGSYCSFFGLCTAAGTKPVGGGCGTSADCVRGLVCESFGFSGSCAVAGQGDLEAPCAGLKDCLAGLSCGESGVCAPGSPTFGLKLWAGSTCTPEDKEGPARIHFEVPRAEIPQLDDSDFFRLPFPNDIRMKNGTVDLTGFPTPGPGVVGFDPVRRIMDAAQKFQKGFSTEPGIIFRLSRGFQLGSIWAAGISDPPPGEPTMYFVNITPTSPQYRWTPDFGYFVTDGGSHYVCPRYLGVHPSWNTPLLPKTTYAVILAKGIKTTDGTEFAADADFTAMLGGTRPENADLAAAWDKYATLRAFLADPQSPVAAQRVIAATVFTTQPVDDVLPKVREAIQAGAMPAPENLTLCAAGTQSPCDDGLTGEAHVRGCFAESAEAFELHFKIPLPIVQKGTRPYLTPELGGDLVIDASGNVTLQGSEDVCVALTIPKKVAMPANGWPLAIYGHGTGGSFRSAVADAGIPLANVTPEDAGGGPAVGMAVLGWDGPMHGARRGADLDPEGLFYNFANPLAARGNHIQGAADVFALVRAMSVLNIAAAASPTGSAIKFDTSRIAYVGHSQGATTGPLATPYEPGIRAVVWSGAGAGLVLSLLAKKSPVDAPRAVAVALQEIADGEPAELSDLHPALGLIQGVFDSVDPLNHARLQLVEPRPGMPIQHVLLVEGMGDSYTPNRTAETFARVLRVQQAPTVIAVLAGLGTAEAPAKENVQTPLGPATGVLVQGQPDGYDGHFVMFRNEAVKRQYRQWLGTFARDGVPVLVAP